MKVRKVFKYGTGAAIPEGAIYVSTQVEKRVTVDRHAETRDETYHEKNALVWHYFLVEVEENAPRAFSAGIIQLDGEDLGSAKKGDLFILMKDTPENRHVQADLLRA